MTRLKAGVQQLSSKKLVELGGNLLEGPCWDPRTGQLLVVDIIDGKVFKVDWLAKHVTSIRVGESVSAVIPSMDGNHVIACRRGIATIDHHGDLHLLVAIENDRRWMRTNDAKCDPAGRLWVGTMADDEREGAASLYRVNSSLSCTKMLSDVTVSNGIGWSPDGRRMYYIDSAARRVDILSFDMTSGDATDRQMLIDAAGYAGLPDGLSVDAEGCIWVAFYGGSVVRRFAPDGRLLAVVDVPTPNVTSCAFAGPKLDHLVITTARLADINARETGGDVYVTLPGVVGLPTSAFSG